MGVLLRDGLIITVVGMGVVFAALALLWGIMAAMQRLLPAGEKPLARLWRRDRKPGTPGGTPAPAQRAAAAATISVAQGDPASAELAAVVLALELWRNEEAAEEAIGWRLPPLLTRWLAVGRSRQLQSWSGRR
jgi:Na+-transporting methylmalonyl-CoA/oxaloacetate decarboxylase gamma subunit